MLAIARTHASTRATSLMRAKKAFAIFVYDTYCLGHWNEENENIKHQIELLIIFFSIVPKGVSVPAFFFHSPS